MNVVRSRLLPLALGLAILLAPAVAGAVDLPEALARADQRAGVVNARSTLRDAERTLERTEADPLALRMDRVRARHAVREAEAELRAARLDARREIVVAYTEAREAELRLELAERARDVSQRALDIARLRLERGGATQLDVDDAEAELADARANVASGRNGVELARSNLASLTGLEVDMLEPIGPARFGAALPPREAWLDALDAHPSVLAARHGLEQARVGLELLDPAYAPGADIDAARLQVEQAEEGLTESERGARLQIRQLHDAAANARESMALARETFTNAEARQEVERQRLDAGLISEMAFERTRLSSASARVDAVAAEHAYLRALFDLQAEAAAALEDVDGS